MLTSRRFRPLLLLLLSGVAAAQARHEEVEVEAVLALPQQPRPQVLQRPQPGERHPVERLALVADVGEALRTHRPRGRRLSERGGEVVEITPKTFICWQNYFSRS